MVEDRLAAIRTYIEAATEAPWWFDESERSWRLHGTAGWSSPGLDGLIPAQPINKQILKAPKHGTPYAEYWPDAADGEFIIKARTDLPALLAAVEAVLEVADRLDRDAKSLHRPGIFNHATAIFAAERESRATDLRNAANEIRRVVAAALADSKEGTGRG